MSTRPCGRRGRSRRRAGHLGAANWLACTGLGRLFAMANLARAQRSVRLGALLCATLLGAAFACGGTALVDGPTGKAGATSVAGAPSVVAGAPHGAGAPPVGGAPSVGGAGGSAPADACSAPQISGVCDAFIPSFWHDPKTGLCVPFIYGGCGGNANRYASRDACLQACPGPKDDWGACTDDSNCTLIGSGCCAACEPFDGTQLIAIDSAHVPIYDNSHCAGSGACAPCLTVPENEQTGKYFKPVCRNAHCTAIDVRETALTECKKTSDCALRDGAECCPQCDGSGWVPVNKSANLCGGAPTACDACTSPLPANWDTVCLGGRCRLEGPL